MKTWVWLAILTVWVAPRVRAQEVAGDAAGARAALAEAARNRPQDAGALGEYAEFLDRYGDPGARDAYEKLLAALAQAAIRARGGGSETPGSIRPAGWRPQRRRLARPSLREGDR